MPAHASTVRSQGRTLGSAKNHQEPWASVEIEWVVETRDVPAEEVAEILGRTLYAVQNARYALDHGIPIGGGSAPQAPTSRQRTYTFVGDDVPPGWND